MGGMSPSDTSAKRRSVVVEWLNSLFPGLNIPLQASEEELRVQLFDGTLLYGIVYQQDPVSPSRGAYMPSEQRREKVIRFISAVEGMGLPGFSAADLEHGSISAVVDCLLYLREYLSLKGNEDGIHETANLANQRRKKWITSEDDRDAMDASHGNIIKSEKSSPVGEVEKKRNFQESRFPHVLHGPVLLEQSSATLHHSGYKFHEVFQLKQEHISDIPAAKVSEIIKSSGLDNAPTQSLLSVINGILDESIERKNGEIPLRVAGLLRKVVQEIERRILTQAEHIRNINNVIKVREEKYQSRIRVLETLASGTNEETQIVSNQLQMIKSQKVTMEASKRREEQRALCLMKDKKNGDQMILKLKQELETAKNIYEHRCQQLEVEAKQNEVRLQERIKVVEILLAESSKRTKELEAFSESKFENWNKKENIFHNFMSFQLQSAKGLRMLLEPIKVEIINSQRKWREEMDSMGVRLKVLVNAAENYHTVLAENRKLYNEVQELKGNIRVYCRIRPFLPGQSVKSTTVDFIGENGELLLVNPSRQGKDGHRMFKFNKVFGPTATQVQVFLDIQPLIRSVLDGYNVCIFAYGQTGSGKTYTMSGPNTASEEEWGVDYRALSDLFHISEVRRNAFTYEVGVQMVEIYNEQVRDLLSNSTSQKRLGIWSISQPNGLAVPDASMASVKSTSDVLELMHLGQMNRAVSSTALNERSSRSHSILTVHVRGVDLKTGSTTRGCLHLIDLAGSERVERSEVTGDRLKEAQHINRSLSALGDVIFALSQKSVHVPYRNSKLTQVLQSSLGGQAKTLMFVQVSPDGESYSETLSTLKFAERVSGVELGAARSNKEGKDVKDLIEQVASLKETISRKDEEIEQLQMLKDLRTQISKSNTLRQSSSHGISSFGGDAASQLSILNGGNAGENCLADDETGDSGDAESAGRFSDISCGDLSASEEPEISLDRKSESAVFPEAGKSSEVMTEKIPKSPSRIPKPLLQRTGQTLSTRTKSSDSLKSLVPKKITSSHPASSSARQMKR